VRLQIDLLKKILSGAAGKLRVVKYGNPCLRRKSVPVENVTTETRDLADRMIVAMMDAETGGVGLAAPQVGVNTRLIVIATHDPAEPTLPNASAGERLLGARMPLALVNPEVTVVGDKRGAANEGCLSVPEVSADVERPLAVMLQTETLDGEKIEVECAGLLARCLQHEIDHLDGILFVDRLPDPVRCECDADLKVIERQERRLLKKQKA